MKTTYLIIGGIVAALGLGYFAYSQNWFNVKDKVSKLMGKSPIDHLTANTAVGTLLKKDATATELGKPIYTNTGIAGGVNVNA